MAVVLGVLWTGINIWDRVSAPAVDIAADVTVVPLRVPPQLLKDVCPVGGRTVLDYTSPSKEAPAPSIDPRTALLMEERCKLRAEHLMTSLSYSNMYLVIANIQNTGNKTATSVSVALPAANEGALVSGADGTQEALTNATSIEVGNLRPGERVEIATWTPYIPLLWDNGLRVTHADGVVLPSVPHVYSGLQGWVNRYWDMFPSFLMALPVVVIILASLIGAARESRKKRRHAGSESTVDEAENDGNPAA